MTAELTPQLRDLLNYLLNAPRANPDAPSRDLTVWWLGTGPYIPEVSPAAGPLFRAPPADLNPHVLDALAATGLIAISKDAQVWTIHFAPEALPGTETAAQPAAGWDFAWPEPEPSPPATGMFAGWDRLLDELAAEEAAQAAAAQATRVRLAQLIDETYDTEELQNLCFDLGLDYGNLRGERKASKARDLVSHMDKLGRLAELQQTLAAQRPGHYARLFGAQT